MASAWAKFNLGTNSKVLSGEDAEDGDGDDDGVEAEDVDAGAGGVEVENEATAGLDSCSR